MLIFEREVHDKDIDDFAQDVASELVKRSAETSEHAFVCWLKGDLGTGKTTIVRSILYAMGLDPAIPVLSPTFTYLTEYVIGTKTFAHVDLYRMVDGDTTSVESLFDQRKFHGVFVEWPERAPDSEAIKPTHILEGEILDQTRRTWHFVQCNFL